jgi:hypothetical protein
MTSPKDEYPYIVLWGRYLGSYDYYIEQEVAQAKKDNAPKNATFTDSTGRWHTFDEVKNPSTIEWFAQNMKKGKK